MHAAVLRKDAVVVLGATAPGVTQAEVASKVEAEVGIEVVREEGVVELPEEVREAVDEGAAVGSFPNTKTNTSWRLTQTMESSRKRPLSVFHFMVLLKRS